MFYLVLLIYDHLSYFDTYVYNYYAILELVFWYTIEVD